MRKLMIMASMLAMVLLAASPAMAQYGANAEQNAAAGDNSNINQQICQNVIGDIVVVNENEANISDDDTAVAVGGDQYSDTVASNKSLNVIAQENNTTVNVVQSCFQAAIQTGDIAIDNDQVIVHKDKVEDDAAADDAQYVAPEDDAAADDAQYVAPEDDAAASAEADAAASAEADAEAGAVAVLPDTGGASLFTLAAGALLVAGGLLARRIVR